MSAPTKFVRCWTLKRGPIDPPEELDAATCRRIALNYIPPTKEQMDRIHAAQREPKPAPNVVVMTAKPKRTPLVELITSEEFSAARDLYPDVVEAVSRLRECAFGTSLRLKAGATPFHKIKTLRSQVNRLGFGVMVVLRGTRILMEKRPLRKKRKVVRRA